MGNLRVERETHVASHAQLALEATWQRRGGTSGFSPLPFFFPWSCGGSKVLQNKAGKHEEYWFTSSWAVLPFTATHLCYQHIFMAHLQNSHVFFKWSLLLWLFLYSTHVFLLCLVFKEEGSNPPVITNAASPGHVTDIILKTDKHLPTTALNPPTPPYNSREWRVSP